jgi:hypothetical protein
MFLFYLHAFIIVSSVFFVFSNFLKLGSIGAIIFVHIYDIIRIVAE